MHGVQLSILTRPMHSSLAVQYDGSQGSSPGGSGDRRALDVDVGAEKDPEYHKTDLRTACSRGYVKRVQVLLDQGADVNQYWHVSAVRCAHVKALGYTASAASKPGVRYTGNLAGSLIGIILK